ncbi:DegV family protein [Eupransor demetentiae]|uniref:DegV family protein n=1 Tax=Eupransor demetentiae TaxID=3109584 RepID=A0ABM9N566_9LACO|nr:Fatty acid-binding protein DegV (function unknown) (DegV) [Lactobacillaceae bacterium LMG 33000]
MSKIAVIIDSSAAIPAEKRNHYHLFQVDVPILFGDETYLGDKDIHSLGQLVDMIKEKKVLPTTSQPTPGQWEQALNDAKNAGYDQAVIITLSSGISGAFQTATLVAQGYEGMGRVEVLDSRLTNMGAGEQAILASVLAEKGHDMDEILTKVAELRASLDVRFVVNDISHLQRTGRLSRGQALIGGLLNIKPLLAFDIEGDGKIGAVGRARKMSGARLEIKTALDEYLRKINYPVRAYVVDGNNPKLGDKWLKEFQTEYPAIQFERASMDPVIGVHTGDGGMALIWSRDWESMV